MRVNTKPVHAVVEALKHWIRAVEERRHADALARVGDIRRLSLALAEVPGFQFLLARHRTLCGTDDPRQVVACVTAFLDAITVLGDPDALTPGFDRPMDAAQQPSWQPSRISAPCLSSRPHGNHWRTCSPGPALHRLRAQRR